VVVKAAVIVSDLGVTFVSSEDVSVADLVETGSNTGYAAHHDARQTAKLRVKKTKYVSVIY